MAMYTCVLLHKLYVSVTKGHISAMCACEQSYIIKTPPERNKKKEGKNITEVIMR